MGLPEEDNMCPGRPGPAAGAPPPAGPAGAELSGGRFEGPDGRPGVGPEGPAERAAGGPAAAAAPSRAGPAGPVGGPVAGATGAWAAGAAGTERDPAGAVGDGLWTAGGGGGVCEGAG
jgi:hypothetical protein